jgi:CheY-like chemotaxis protein
MNLVSPRGTGQNLGIRGNLAGLSILVVDDTIDSLEMLSLLLQLHGASVTSAESAREALDLYERQNFDVVVSDIGMPVEDGYTLIRKLRGIEAGRAAPPVPAVALTGYAEYADRNRAIEAGFQDHLRKPVDANRLISIITKLVR